MGLLGFINLTRITYLLFGIQFLITGFVINILQFFLYIILRPVCKHLFRRINYYLSYSLFSHLVFLEQYWADVKVTLHVSKSDFAKYLGKEQALLIMNHSYEIDWLIGWILCDNCCILGNCKTFAKKSIQYIPTLGYAWKIGGSIFLERNWKKDQNVFQTKLQELVSYRDPWWLLFTAEGTRFTKEKHEESKTFAREHGLPELRHHLTPRTRGFITTLSHLRKKIPAIYNVNVGVKPDGVQATLNNVLLGKSISADFYVERIPIEELPESEEGAANWLHALYKKKDDMLHSYLKTGDWFEISGVKKCDNFLLPRRIYPALNTLLWSVLLLIPLGCFIISLLLSGSVLYFGSAVAIITSLILLLDKMVGETRISNASTYGISKVKATT